MFVNRALSHNQLRRQEDDADSIQLQACPRGVCTSTLWTNTKPPPSTPQNLSIMLKHLKKLRPKASGESIGPSPSTISGYYHICRLKAVYRNETTLHRCVKVATRDRKRFDRLFPASQIVCWRRQRARPILRSASPSDRTRSR